MKAKINQWWGIFFQFVAHFFGIRGLKAICMADKDFFAALQDDEDDLTDREFYLTEKFAIQFTEDIVSFPEKRTIKIKKRPA